MSIVDALPSLTQITFGGGTVQERELAEVGVFRHDHEPVLAGIRPDLGIRRRVKADLRDVSAVRILDREHANEMPRQVLVEQEPHAGEASRRSRSAANSIAARTCRSDSSGKSATICSVVIPDAR